MDDQWKSLPPTISQETVESFAQALKDYVEHRKISNASITFHGGEPTLVGITKLTKFCDTLISAAGDNCKLDFSIQTNGINLSQEWAALFEKYDFKVGMSLDGPPDVNDRNRYDHKGRGTAWKVERAARTLNSQGVRFEILCVIPLGQEPLRVHKYLKSLEPHGITYIFPDFTSEEISSVQAKHGATPCADFLLPILDYWVSNDLEKYRIGDLWNMMMVVAGAPSRIETVGGVAPRYLFLETNGDMEYLDSLRSCSNGLTKTGLNVGAHTISCFEELRGPLADVVFNGAPLPSKCKSCEESSTCSGGYLPHRYSISRGFDNPSVWCADNLKLFRQIRLLVAANQ